MKTAVLVLAAMLVPALASAQVPEYLPYQGYLTNADGDPIDALVDLTFNIYEGGNDQVPMWTETHRGVVVDGGVFYVQLANNQPIVDDVVAGTTRYLGIAVNQDAEAEPRQRIGSVPYAMLAADSLALGGIPAEDFAPRDEVQEMINQVVIDNGGGLNADQVNQLIDARNYVDGDAVNVLIDARNYLSRDEILELIQNNAGDGGLDEDAVNALIDARNFVNEDQVNALIDARNYVNEDQVNALIDARLVDLVERIENIENQIQNIQNNNAGAPFILGVSAQSSNGRISFNGRSGIQGAREMCRATYANEPTAHMCTYGEVSRALAAEAYRDGNNINNVNTWSLGEATLGGNFTGTYFNTCQNLMYNSGDVATGTRLTVTLNRQSNGNGGGVTGHSFDVRQNIGCGQNYPVLCCR